MNSLRTGQDVPKHVGVVKDSTITCAFFFNLCNKLVLYVNQIRLLRDSLSFSCFLSSIGYNNRPQFILYNY